MGQTVSAIPQAMQDNQKIMMLGQREMMMASQVAKMRDDFRWLCAFDGTVLTLVTLGFLKTHNPRLLIPWVPMSFSLAYFYDAAYGTKFDRIRLGTEELLKNERAKFTVPAGNRMMSPEEYAVKIIGESLDLSKKIGGGL
jgi:hypothetical protein